MRKVILGFGFALVALIGVTVFAQGFNDPQEAGGALISDPSPTLSAPLTTGANPIRAGAETSDAPPKALVLKGGMADANTCTGANCYGAPVVISPGQQKEIATSVANSLGAVTVTVTCCYQHPTTGVATCPSGVALASGTDFALGSDDTAPQLAVTAANLKTAINAHATLSLCALASNAAAIVYLETTARGYYLSAATSAAPRISVTHGTTAGVYFYVRNTSAGSVPYPIEIVKDTGGRVAFVEPGTATELTQLQAKNLSSTGFIIAGSYLQATTYAQVASGATMIKILPGQDVGASCTVGEVVLNDTGGATSEICVCTATNTWKCVALGAGPAD